MVGRPRAATASPARAIAASSAAAWRVGAERPRPSPRRGARRTSGADDAADANEVPVAAAARSRDERSGARATRSPTAGSRGAPALRDRAARRGGAAALAVDRRCGRDRRARASSRGPDDHVPRPSRDDPRTSVGSARRRGDHQTGHSDPGADDHPGGRRPGRSRRRHEGVPSAHRDLGAPRGGGALHPRHGAGDPDDAPEVGRRRGGPQQPDGDRASPHRDDRRRADAQPSGEPLDPSRDRHARARRRSGRGRSGHRGEHLHGAASILDAERPAARREDPRSHGDDP